MTPLSSGLTLNLLGVATVRECPGPLLPAIEGRFIAWVVPGGAHLDFDNWMDRINRVCEMQFGLSIHDLPDMCFRDAFDSGMSAEDFMTENLPDMESLGHLIMS